MKRLHLKPEHKNILIELYNRTHKTVDGLPYTEEFERLYESFVQRSGLNLTRHHVWRALARQRKAKHLVRKER
jgi:hypothetical protein